jgi:dTMP kinase
MFLTFEGLDGSGKTTQVALLADRLRQAGEDLVVTREPGGTPVGAELRRILLDSPVELTPVSEAMLMTADRAEHVERVIRPALARGLIVISDRYLDSTLAYQGAGRGLPHNILEDMQQLATGGLMPDMTFLLDVPVEAGLSRKLGGTEMNRLDRESIVFHQSVADGFRRLAARDVVRWRVVDATQEVHMVHTAIWLHVSAHLEARRRALVRGESL